MSHYRYSHPVSTAELKKCGVFTTIEVRNHNQEELAYQGSREFIEIVSQSWDYEISWRACAQENGHAIALCIPECLPERLALLSAVCDLALLQDDLFENMTDAQRENVTQEEITGFQSVLQRKGLPPNSLAMFPKLAKDFTKKMLEKDPNLASSSRKEVDRVSTAPPKDRMTYDTLDSYLDERLRDVSMRWMFELCAYGMDLRLNEQEQEQSRLPTLALQKAAIYTNDFFSWAKEKAEQEEVAANKEMFSAVAVLMKEHKISETEALEMVREKTIECEKEHFAAVSNLELAGPISENLSRYLDMTRLCHSGIMLWSALTDRYNKFSPAQMNGEGAKNCSTSLVSTTVERSAKMGMPISSSNGVEESNSSVTSSAALLVEDKASSAVESAMNGTIVKHQPKGTKNSEEIKVTLKESAKDITLAPYEYLKSLPSKEIRELLINGLNNWLQVPELPLGRVRNIITMLYTSSLMLDDIEDGSKLRRGMPSAHVVYGESQTINSATYVQTCAFAEAAKLSNPISMSIVCDEMSNLYIGQSQDLAWQFYVYCPSEEDYLEMVDAKTGSLFRMILGLMQAESPLLQKHETQLDNLIQQLGRYFHVRDDYQTLVSNDYTQQKCSREDLNAGQISLPFIDSMQHSSPTEKAQITGILKRRGANGLLPEMKRMVLKHLDERTASLAYTREMLKRMESELEEKLEAMEKFFDVPNPLLRSLLAELVV